MSDRPGDSYCKFTSGEIDALERPKEYFGLFKILLCFGSISLAFNSGANFPVISSHEKTGKAVFTRECCDLGVHFIACSCNLPYLCSRNTIGVVLYHSLFRRANA